MAAALARFPEALALPVDSQLRANVEALQSQWFVRGLALKKLLRTQPQVRGGAVLRYCLQPARSYSPAT